MRRGRAVCSCRASCGKRCARRRSGFGGGAHRAPAGRPSRRLALRRAAKNPAHRPQRAMSPRIAWGLLAPALAFVSLFFVLPVLALLAGAFKVDGGAGLAHFVAFFAEPLHEQVYWRTLRIALLATLVSAVVAWVLFSKARMLASCSFDFSCCST